MMSSDVSPAWLSKQTHERSGHCSARLSEQAYRTKYSAPSLFITRGLKCVSHSLLHLSDTGYEAIQTLKIHPSSLIQFVTVVITVFGHNGTDLHQNSMDLCDTHTPIHPQNHQAFPSTSSSSVSPHYSMKNKMKRPLWCTIASNSKFVDVDSQINNMT